MVALVSVAVYALKHPSRAYIRPTTIGPQIERDAHQRYVDNRKPMGSHYLQVSVRLMDTHRMEQHLHRLPHWQLAVVGGERLL